MTREPILFPYIHVRLFFIMIYYIILASFMFLQKLTLIISGSFGGSMGLILGCSLITILEAFFFLLMCISIGFRFLHVKFKEYIGMLFMNFFYKMYRYSHICIIICFRNVQNLCYFLGRTKRFFIHRKLYISSHHTVDVCGRINTTSNHLLQ